MARSDQRKANRQNQANFLASQKQAQGQFDAQMDQSIQRRVSDASKAGIHPLFAMGASVGASPTLHSGTPPQIETGSGMGNALARVADRIGQSRMNNAAAERDEAEAALLNSQRKRLEGNFQSRGRDGASVKTFPYGTNPGPEVVFGPPEHYNPQVATSSRVGVESGTHPGTIDVITPDSRKVNIPSPNIGLDEVAQIDYVYQRAIHKGTDAMMAVRNMVNKFKSRQGKRWKSTKMKRPKHLKRRY